MKKIYMLVLVLVLLGSLIPTAVSDGVDECSSYNTKTGKEHKISCNALNSKSKSPHIIHYTNRCSYPDIIGCNTDDEALLIAREWEIDQCSNDEMLACIDNWIISNPAECSYPEIIDCDSYAEVEIITSEWEAGLCTWEELDACITYWATH